MLKIGIEGFFPFVSLRVRMTRACSAKEDAIKKSIAFRMILALDGDGTNMLEKQLQQLGFHKNEAMVYLALFDLGKCRAGDIINNTKLHRNLVYTALEELTARELVSKTLKGGVAEFSANDPSHLIDEVDNKKQLASSVVEKLKNLRKEEPREVKVFEGVEGLQKFKDKTFQLPKGDTCYIISTGVLSNAPELDEFWRKYHRQRARHGLKAKFLFDRTTNKEFLDWRQALPNTQTKYLPFGTNLPMWFEVFGDYLGIGFPGKEPLMFSIKSKEAAEGMKEFFNYFWNQSVSTESGTEALKKTIYEMLNELKSGEEYYVIGASAGDAGGPVQRLYDQFHKDRIKKGVIANMLVYRESYDRIKKRFDECGDPSGKVSQLRTYTSAPNIPMQINMYNGKAFIILYGQEPTVIHFEKSEIYAGFKTYFDELWNTETQILTGPKELQKIWLESIDYKELRLISARGYFIDRYPDLYKTVEEKAKNTPGVKWKNIVDPGVRGHQITKLPWAETKYSLSGAKNPNVVWLYGPKVVITNWAGDEPIMFVSTNKQLVQSYNDYFEELWRQ